MQDTGCYKMFNDENTTGYTAGQLIKMNEELYATLDGYRMEGLTPDDHEEVLKRESERILKKYN